MPEPGIDLDFSLQLEMDAEQREADLAWIKRYQDSSQSLQPPPPIKRVAMGKLPIE